MRARRLILLVKQRVLQLDFGLSGEEFEQFAYWFVSSILSDESRCHCQKRKLSFSILLKTEYLSQFVRAPHLYTSKLSVVLNLDNNFQIRGLGPGRMTSVQGMATAGVKVVSITEQSALRELGPRPKKIPRI